LAFPKFGPIFQLEQIGKQTGRNVPYNNLLSTKEKRKHEKESFFEDARVLVFAALLELHFRVSNHNLIEMRNAFAPN
jgi:hypothetical protein